MDLHGWVGLGSMGEIVARTPDLESRLASSFPDGVSGGHSPVASILDAALCLRIQSASTTFNNDWYGTSRRLASRLSSSSSQLGIRKVTREVDGLSFGKTAGRGSVKSTNRSRRFAWLSRYAASSRSFFIEPISCTSSWLSTR